MKNEPEHGVVAITGTYPISRELLGKIVDDVFDGAIEDASVIEQIYAAIKKHEPHPPKPGSRGIPVGEIVAASTPAAEILYGLDVKFYEALRSLPIGTQLYAASVDSAVDPQPPAENVGDDECDHKGKGLAVMSWGACCAGCGEPHPFDAPQPTVAITDGVVATPAPSEHVMGYPIEDEDLRYWRVWWHGSGPQRGDHIMLASRYDLGYEREIAYLGDQHHEAASALVHLHNITVDKLRVAAPAPAQKTLVSAPANPSGREAESAKIDGMLRKLEALRIAFDMHGANATTILRVINTLSTMKNAIAAVEVERDHYATGEMAAVEKGMEHFHRAETAEAKLSALQARIQGLEKERRMIISHATMGQTDGEGLSVNDVSVRITQLRNELYRAALNKDEKHG